MYTLPTHTYIQICIHISYLYIALLEHDRLALLIPHKQSEQGQWLVNGDRCGQSVGVFPYYIDGGEVLRLDLRKGRERMSDIKGQNYDLLETNTTK